MTRGGCEGAPHLNLLPWGEEVRPLVPAQGSPRASPRSAFVLRYSGDAFGRPGTKRRTLRRTARDPSPAGDGGCNLCGSEEYSQQHVVRGYTIVRCDDCGLTFLNPRPVAGELATIYDTADYYGGGSEYEDVRLGYPNYLALEAHLAFVVGELLRPLRGMTPGMRRGSTRRSGFSIRRGCSPRQRWRSGPCMGSRVGWTCRTASRPTRGRCERAGGEGALARLRRVPARSLPERGRGLSRPRGGGGSRLTEAGGARIMEASP